MQLTFIVYQINTCCYKQIKYNMWLIMTIITVRITYSSCASKKAGIDGQKVGRMN
jgi:hypothetical protein